MQIPIATRLHWRDKLAYHTYIRIPSMKPREVRELAYRLLVGLHPTYTCACECFLGDVLLFRIVVRSIIYMSCPPVWRVLLLRSY